MTVKAKEGGLRTKMLMYLERPEGARHQRGGSPVGRRTSSPVTPHIWGDGLRFKMDHLFISNVMVKYNIYISLSQNTDFSKYRLTLLTRHVNW